MSLYSCFFTLRYFIFNSGKSGTFGEEAIAVKLAPNKMQVMIDGRSIYTPLFILGRSGRDAAGSGPY